MSPSTSIDMGWGNEDGGRVKGLFISEFHTEYMNFDLLEESYAPKPPLVRAGYNVKSIWSLLRLWLMTRRSSFPECVKSPGTTFNTLLLCLNAPASTNENNSSD
jgi:hypothetical protein